MDADGICSPYWKCEDDAGHPDDVILKMLGVSCSKIL